MLYFTTIPSNLEFFIIFLAFRRACFVHVYSIIQFINSSLTEPRFVCERDDRSFSEVCKGSRTRADPLKGKETSEQSSPIRCRLIRDSLNPPWPEN